MIDESKTKEQLIEELRQLRRQISELNTHESACSEALKVLRVDQQRFDDVAGNVFEWVWEIDVNGKYTYSSRVVEHILGYRTEEVLAMQFYDLFHHEDRERLKTQVFEQLHKKRPFRELILRNVHKNGKTVWLSRSGIPVIDEAGTFRGYRGADFDVTERQEMLETLREAEEICRLVMQSATDALILVDDSQKILIWNKSAESLFGYSADEVIGKPLQIIIPERFRLSHERGMQRLISMENSWFMGRDFEITSLRKDGTEFPVEISLAKWNKEDKLFFTGIIRDITKRKTREQKLHDASMTDELTGHLNRRGFLHFTQKHMEIANRSKMKFSLLYLDLNDLKAINDEFGHDEGDQALISFASLLKTTFRSSDVIARMGGDEFVVLITESRGIETEKTVMDNLQNNLRKYNEEAERSYKLSVSTGMAHYDPQHPCSLEELLSSADKLMYDNKQQYQFEKAGLKNLKKITRENRIGKRFKVEENYKVELIVPDSVMIKNISINGMCLETRQRLVKNTAYSIRISPFHEEKIISLTGIVVWSTLEDSVSDEDSGAGYSLSGLRFVGMNESVRNEMRNFLTNLRMGKFTLSLFH